MRRKRKVYFTHRKQRSVLTDMLPFEVPPTFTNRGFYRFLKDNNIELIDDCIVWHGEDKDVEIATKILFGIAPTTRVDVITCKQWGSLKTINSIAIDAKKRNTIPFNFRVAHNIEGRTLSVVHPRNQIQVASFYAKYSALITYYTSLSNYSIRKPVAVSRYAYFKDRLHALKLDTSSRVMEVADHEYEQLGSFFTYEKFRNIHHFFESYKYHRCEKKYDEMVQVDVSKCFDSIYTHSLPWALFGKEQIKFSLRKSKKTFGGEFDALMQALNHEETNGIVIGPEFSRVFAEIILQSVDVETERLLRARNLIHKVHYEMFRYVDDYFIFYNKTEDQVAIVEVLQEVLKSKKLSINSAKSKYYKKPIITEITIAKQKISTLLDDEIAPICIEVRKKDETEPERLDLKCFIDSNKLIIKYKTAIKESKVTYEELLNYTFAILENKLAKLFECYKSAEKTKCGSNADAAILAEALKRILEVSFFIYSASPKVNHTIRLCRILSTTVYLLHNYRIHKELKHLVFKYAHENVLQQLKKNGMTDNREVENLYLLISLLQIGKEYWLPEELLAEYFKISYDEKSKKYKKNGTLSHFSITVLLSYLKEKKRYQSLRNFVETLVVEQLKDKRNICRYDAESLFILFDLTVCPYISQKCKNEISRIFELTQEEAESISRVSQHWFTAWGDKFDLASELDAKRSREVY